jgi:iron complex transport system substrate-binding protein
MKLKMPDKVTKMALKDGYYALSPEVLPEYAGEYLTFSKSAEADNSFTKTDTFINTPAVKNAHVFEVDSKEFYFNDPLTLEHQLEFFKKSCLGA